MAVTAGAGSWREIRDKAGKKKIEWKAEKLPDLAEVQVFIENTVPDHQKTRNLQVKPKQIECQV